jgi:hypothetical protein
MKQFIIISVSASLSLFIAGCGTTTITDYKPAAPAASEKTAQQSGVEVAVDPFVDNGRTETYFDLDALANGIAILHVRVLNQSAGQTFLVEKENFKLITDGTGTGLSGNGQKIEQPKLGGEILTGMGGVTALAGLAMLSRATEIQRNLIAKELPDQTLSPGQSMEGFIYFTPVEKGKDWSHTATLKVGMTETKSHQVIELSIPFSH